MIFVSFHKPDSHSSTHEKRKYEKTSRQEKRGKKNSLRRLVLGGWPIFSVVLFVNEWLLWQLPWVEQRGLNWLDAPMSNVIRGPQLNSPSLQLLPIWAQHLFNAGHLNNYEYQLPWSPSTRCLSICMWFICPCDCSGQELECSLSGQISLFVNDLEKSRINTC